MLQGKVKGCALAYRALRPDLAAMAVYDALHGGKANAGALELVRSMHTLEGAKKFRGVGHFKPGPIVPHEEGWPVLVDGHAQLGPRPRHVSREFPGVLQQVFQRHGE